MKMSKAIFIILIVFASIFLMEFSYSTSDSTSESYNYGESWVSYSDYEKCIYIMASEDGSTDVYFRIIELMWKIEPSIAPSEFGKIMSKLLKFGEDLEPLVGTNFYFTISVMTEWYKDPANAYIPHAELFRIAREKLSGKAVEKLLEEKRKKFTP